MISIDWILAILSGGKVNAKRLDSTACDRLLKACLHGRNLGAAMRVFNLMRHSHSIVPTPKVRKKEAGRNRQTIPLTPGIWDFVETRRRKGEGCRIGALPVARLRHAYLVGPHLYILRGACRRYSRRL